MLGQSPHEPRRAVRLDGEVALANAAGECVQRQRFAKALVTSLVSIHPSRSTK
jgi:hypothetical protein